MTRYETSAAYDRALKKAIQHYLEDECAGVLPEAYAQPQGRITVVGSEAAELPEAA